MKRSLCFIVTAALLLSLFGFVASAAESVTVYSDSPLSTKQGEELTVPINVKNNSGLMGFRITVNYPDEQLKLKNISSGSVTKSGLFNTTVSSYDLVKGSFDILWSNNSGVSADGTLAIISFAVKNSAKDGSYQINTSFSQEDTFDGDFNDVKFSCQPIKVLIGKETTTEQKEQTNPDDKTTNEKVSDDYLVNVVNDGLDSLGGKEFSELSEVQQQQLLKAVNNKIDAYNKGAKKYKDFKKLCNDYSKAAKNEAVRKVMESADDSEITGVIKAVLNKYGAKKFKDIPKEKRREAIQKIINGLYEKNADISGFDSLSDDEVAEVIDKMMNQSDKQSKSGELAKNPAINSSKGKTYKIIIIVALCLTATVLTIYFLKAIIKRRTKNEKD